MIGQACSHLPNVLKNKKIKGCSKQSMGILTLPIEALHLNQLIILQTLLNLEAEKKINKSTDTIWDSLPNLRLLQRTKELTFSLERVECIHIKMYITNHRPSKTMISNVHIQTIPMMIKTNLTQLFQYFQWVDSTPNFKAMVNLLQVKKRCFIDQSIKETTTKSTSNKL